MVDSLERTLTEAGINLLRNVAPAMRIYPDTEGNTPQQPTMPYVVVHSMVEFPTGHPANALDGVSNTAVVRWYVHNVGVTEPAALAVHGRTRAALLNQRPAVAGRNCGMIRQDAAPPPARDMDAGVIIYEQTAVYSMTVT